MIPEIAVCWFCNRPAAVEARAVRVELYGNVTEKLGELMTYEKTAVVIPRCAACARAHAFEGFLQFLGLLAGGIAGLVLCWTGARAMGAPVIPVIFLVGSAILGGLAGFALLATMGKYLIGKRRSWEGKDDFPALRELVEQGWKEGSEPKENEPAERRAA